MGMLAWLQHGEATGLRWLWVSLGILLLDSFSKHWILQHFSLNEVHYCLSWFNAVYVQNPGAAFSLLADQPAWHWLLTATALLVCGVLLLNLVRQSAAQRLLNLAYTLIIGGALGNLLDRWRYGAVIDFIDLHWANWHWPAFNVADSAICLGCALSLWQSFRDQRNPFR